MSVNLNRKIKSGGISKSGLTEALFFSRVKQLGLTNINSNAAVWDYAISGTTMYVAADTDGFYVIDISDPTNPAHTSTVRFRTPAGVITSMAVTDVLVLGSNLYACGRSINFTDTNETGIIAKYDISTPASPSWTASYQPANERVTITPDPDYYHNNWYQGMATDGTYIYLACQTSGLEVIDPTTMTLHGDYTIAELSASGVGDAGMYWECSRIDYSSGWVYLANHGNGVMALDVSTPATPTNPQWYDTPIVDSDQLRPRNVKVVGSYLYVSPNSCSCGNSPERGLMVMDISDPTAVDVDDWAIARIGEDDSDIWNNAGDQPILGLSIYGEYAYLANGLKGTAVFDISNPANPTYYGLFGKSTANLYMSYTFLGADDKVYCYYSDGKEVTQKHNLYVDRVMNP